MIHPDLIEPTAQRAYELFRNRHAGNPAWSGLPAWSRTKWRDAVKDTWTLFTNGEKPKNEMETCLFLSLDELPKEQETHWRDKRADFEGRKNVGKK